MPSSIKTHELGVLVCIRDPLCADEVVRIAGSSGVTPELVPDAIAARRRWPTARLVLVDAAAARECAALRLPRRSGIVLVDRGSSVPADDIWHLANVIGADNVALLPAAETWLMDRLTPRDSQGKVAHLVGVIGGCGGAGASVLSAALGLAGTRQQRRTLLVDADPLGSGLDTTLGYDNTSGLRWSDLVALADNPEDISLLASLPRIGELSLLMWERSKICALTAHAMMNTLETAANEADLTIVDLPRYPDEASLVVLSQADLVLLVVPAQVRAAFAANRVAGLLAGQCRRLECVVRGPSPSKLSADEIAAVLQLPLAGALRQEPRLLHQLEGGKAPGSATRSPLAALCESILQKLEVQDEVLIDNPGGAR